MFHNYNAVRANYIFFEQIIYLEINNESRPVYVALMTIPEYSYFMH